MWFRPKFKDKDVGCGAGPIKDLNEGVRALMARERLEARSKSSKEKISVTVDRHVWEQARTLPWAVSASDVVNEALHRLVAVERLGVMLDRLVDDFGPVDEKLVAEAEAKWFGE